MRYAALLRGVNVGGKNRLAMPALRSAVEGLGFDDVATYVQSGNVVFRAPSQPEASLVRALERMIRGTFRLEVTVLVRTAAQLARIEKENPYLAQRRDPATLHVTFLAARPSAAARGELPRGLGPDELAVRGREVYLWCPNGYGRTKLTNAWFEQRLGTPATTRNWRTVVTLRGLTST
ncbi:MAG TPA: DUF1697 domain-containing protein [Acidimicrobiia bacterium]|nr:DUF1697 domain-containing protein [Acidimicrobiia bacterium]